MPLHPAQIHPGKCGCQQVPGDPAPWPNPQDLILKGHSLGYERITTHKASEALDTEVRVTLRAKLRVHQMETGCPERTATYSRGTTEIRNSRSVLFLRDFVKQGTEKFGQLYHSSDRGQLRGQCGGHRKLFG